MFLLIRLAILVKRKIWPLFFEIASSLFKNCVAYNLCYRRGLFYSPHVSARNVANFEPLSIQYSHEFYTETHTRSSHDISPTLDSHAIHSVLFIFPIMHSKQKYDNNSVYCCRNVRKITIDTLAHHYGICDRITP